MMLHSLRIEGRSDRNTPISNKPGSALLVPILSRCLLCARARNLPPSVAWLNRFCTTLTVPAALVGGASYDNVEETSSLNYGTIRARCQYPAKSTLGAFAERRK